MKTSDVLNTAADLIERRGLGKGVTTWSGNTGPLCIEGALAAAAGVEMVMSLGVLKPARHALNLCPAYVAVKEHLNTKQAVWSWNDTEGRTAAEVIEVLRATAVIEASRESALVAGGVA